MIKVNISNGTGRNNLVKVTDQNQLVVGSFDFSEPIQKNLNIADTAFNFFKPKPGMMMVITEILGNPNRDITANGTIIDIYEASSISSTTIDKSIIQLDLEKQKLGPVLNLNWKVTPGKFLNAKCSEISVLITIAGYFVPI